MITVDEALEALFDICYENLKHADCKKCKLFAFCQHKEEGMSICASVNMHKKNERLYGKKGDEA